MQVLKSSAINEIGQLWVKSLKKALAVKTSIRTSQFTNWKPIYQMPTKTALIFISWTVRDNGLSKMITKRNTYVDSLLRAIKSILRILCARRKVLMATHNALGKWSLVAYFLKSNWLQQEEQIRAGIRRIIVIAIPSGFLNGVTGRLIMNGITGRSALEFVNDELFRNWKTIIAANLDKKPARVMWWKRV